MTTSTALLLLISNLSMTAAAKPSTMETREESAATRMLRKKATAVRAFKPGSMFNASGSTTNTSPTPLATTSWMPTPLAAAMYPRVPKTAKPMVKLKAQSARLTMKALLTMSLFFGR